MFVSNIERGRLEGISGKVVVAEEFLWGEYFRDPGSPHAHWALWEMYEKYPCRWTVQGPGDVQCMAVNRDATVVAVGAADKSVVLMDTENGAVVSRIAGLPSVPLSIAFEPSGERLLIGTSTGAACVARVDASGAPFIWRTRRGRTTTSSALSRGAPTGRYLATGAGDKRIKLWDAVSLSASPIGRRTRKG